MVITETYSGHRSLPSDVIRELERIAARNPFVCSNWLALFERSLLNAHEAPLYFVVRGAGQVLGVLPLVVVRHPILGAVKMRAMGNFYTGLFDVACSFDPAHDRDRTGQVAGALASHLAEHFGRIPLLEMAPVRDVDGPVAQLIKALAGRGYSIRRFPVHGNWFEDVHGRDYDAYLRARPGRVRSTIKRKRSKLERETDWSIAFYRSAAELEENFADYERIYAVSWKTPELSARFIRGSMTDLAGQGLAMMTILRIGEVPAAAQLWVKIGRAWAIFKLAYDPEFAEYSVGTILTAAALEKLFSSDPPDELDFLSGDDAYKRDWMVSRRQHWGFEAISGRSVAGLALRVKRRLSGVDMGAE